MNTTPSGERLHIGILGCMNAGKSSLINAITGQSVSIVAPVEGTTTDPVNKAMELLPLGPVMLTDTPGLDDDGVLGSNRIKSADRVLESVDAAILVVDASQKLKTKDKELIERLGKRGIPYLIACNKCDSVSAEKSDGLVSEIKSCYEVPVIKVSSLTLEGINELKESLGGLLLKAEPAVPIIADLVEPGAMVVLVVPIDKAAPKGRLILPQQQTIRELLERGAYSLVVRDSELEVLLNDLKEKNMEPDLVVTDSQVFEKVNEIVPEHIRLTSFSILMARHKGNLEQAYEGVAAIDGLKDGDTVIISEGCTHHRQCGDIGTQKLPAWIRQRTGADLRFVFTSGREFTEEEILKSAAMVIHCGGCMLTEAEMKYRYSAAVSAGIPVTNYGIAIAAMKGILKRCSSWIMQKEAV